MRHPRPDRWTALLAAIGALGAALVLLRTATYGADVGGDAAGFVSTAHSLLAGGGFVMHYGDPYYREAPPGLPLALAFAGLFGPDPLDAVGYLHAAAFGLTVLAAAAWVRSRTGSRFLAVWAGLALALSPSLGGLFSAAYTDPLFVCYATLSLYALDRYLDGGRRRSLLLAAAVCAALACATRYIGFALVASAVPLLLLAERRGFRPAPRGVANAAIFSAVALAPAGAWMLRNVLTFGSPLGGIRRTGFSPLTDLHAAAGEASRWTLGESGFGTLAAWSEALPGVAAGEPSIAAVLVRFAAPLVLLAVAAAALAPPRGDSRSRPASRFPPRSSRATRWRWRSSSRAATPRSSRATSLRCTRRCWSPPRSRSPRLCAAPRGEDRSCGCRTASGGGRRYPRWRWPRRSRCGCRSRPSRRTTTFATGGPTDAATRRGSGPNPQRYAG